MALSSEVTKALEDLGKERGTKEFGVKDSDRYMNYELLIERSLDNALDLYGCYKVQQSTDWEEIERLEREEAAKRWAERRASVVDSVVIGALSALLPKASRLMPELEADFEMNDHTVVVTLRDEKYDPVFVIDYNRKTKVLWTCVYNPYREYKEDVAVVSGNVRASDQIRGLRMVHEILDAMEPKEKA